MEENHTAFIKSMQGAHEVLRQTYIELFQQWQFNNAMCKHRIKQRDAFGCFLSETDIIQCCMMNCPYSPLPK